MMDVDSFEKYVEKKKKIHPMLINEIDEISGMAHFNCSEMGWSVAFFKGFREIQNLVIKKGSHTKQKNEK